MSQIIRLKENNKNQDQPSRQSISKPIKPQQSEPKEPIQQTLMRLYNLILTTKNHQQLATSIKQYCVMIVLSNREQIFISFFVQCKFLQVLHKKMKQFKYSSELLKAIFSLFQFLIQALKRDEDLIYFLVKINQEGYVSSSYTFQEEEDIAYYANFLKLMIRIINEKLKFLTVFFNHRQPHFPLLLKLLKFYNCSDPVMHTSSKLAIMEISNNNSSLVQKYSKNFPFILFYPCYIGQVLFSFKRSINEQNNSNSLQDLQNHLKFLQEYIMNKDRATIDMYTNTFLYTIGKQIYEELAALNDKNLKRIRKIYKIILNHLIPDISVLKIKLGLLCIFNTDISFKLKKCFQAKEKMLQSNYWIADECQKQIVNHCRKIFFSNESVKQSFFKTINSYIPRSKDNWLYHQMKKISQMIGFSVTLNEEINFDKYNSNSFLLGFQQISDDKSQTNVLTENVIKRQDEELLYLHIKILNNLFTCQRNQVVFNVELLMPSVMSCCSLSLIQMFYTFILQNKILQEQSHYIMSCYNLILQKLIFFVFHKGMKEFLIRIKDSRVEQNQKQFFQDVYREIQCEILLFVALRTLLGFRNENGSKFDLNTWNNQANKTVQTTFKCHGFCQFGPELSVIIDGQYLKIKNKNEQHIHKEELIVSNIQFYAQDDTLVLIGNETTKNYSTTLYFPSDLQSCFQTQIAFRKELSTKIGLILKEMQFQLNY